MSDVPEEWRVIVTLTGERPISWGDESEFVSTWADEKGRFKSQPPKVTYVVNLPAKGAAHASLLGEKLVADERAACRLPRGFTTESITVKRVAQ